MPAWWYAYLGAVPLSPNKFIETSNCFCSKLVTESLISCCWLFRNFFRAHKLENHTDDQNSTVMSASPSLLSITNKGPPFHFLQGPTENPLKAYTAAAKSSSITVCLASQSFTKWAIFLAQNRLPVAGCHNNRSRTPRWLRHVLPRINELPRRDGKNIKCIVSERVVIAITA